MRFGRDSMRHHQRGDRATIDPGDYLPTYPYDLGQETFVSRPRRILPMQAIHLRVSTEGEQSKSSLTVPKMRPYKAMRRFGDIGDPMRGFKRPPIGHRGSVEPARLPHRLLPSPTAGPWQPAQWGPPRRSNPTKRQAANRMRRRHGRGIEP